MIFLKPAPALPPSRNSLQMAKHRAPAGSHWKRCPLLLSQGHAQLKAQPPPRRFGLGKGVGASLRSTPARPRMKFKLLGAHACSTAPSSSASSFSFPVGKLASGWLLSVDLYSLTPQTSHKNSSVKGSQGDKSTWPTHGLSHVVVLEITHAPKKKKRSRSTRTALTGKRQATRLNRPTVGTDKKRQSQSSKSRPAAKLNTRRWILE